MKVIETNRLYLREFQGDDLEAVSKIYADEEVMTYIGRGGTANKEQSMKMIEAFRESYNKNGFGIWAVINKDNDELIGHCGLNILKDTSEVEVAYLLSKNNWGKGYATEAAEACVDHGFNKLFLNKIVALAYPQNAASINVIKKLGMKPEGEREFFGKKFLFFSVVKVH